IERIHAARAATDGSVDARTITEHERVAGRPAGEVLEPREGSGDGGAAESAGVAAGDVPGARRVRAHQGIRPASVADQVEAVAAGGQDLDGDRTGAGVEVEVPVVCALRVDWPWRQVGELRELGESRDGVEGRRPRAATVPVVDVHAGGI